MKYLKIAGLLLISVQAGAQLIDFDSEQLSEEFKEDFRIYSEAYSAPVRNSYGYNLISGWHQTAKIIAPWSVRLEFIAAATSNSDDKTHFNFNEMGFSDNIRLQDPSSPELPTALGGKTFQTLIYEADGNISQSGIPVGSITVEQEIPAFDGISTPGNSVPNLVPQISLGLPRSTEISVRFFPFYKYNGVTHKEFGIGIKHSLDQYIESFPSTLHWNAGVLYNGSRYNYVPEDFLEGSDQDVRLNGKAFMLHTTFSYDYKFITAYVNTGYYSWTSEFSILGTYRYTVEQGTYNGEEVFEVTDPVDISGDSSGMQASVGATFRVLRFMSLTGAYHIANRNTLTVGLSLNFGTKG